MIDTNENKIHFLKEVSQTELNRLPKKFNYPFFYKPHPLCIKAATQTQQYLNNQKDWTHDFGIQNHVEGVNVGKMFGVLLVRTKKNKIGYLAAFSGKLAGKTNHQYFVPPIVDHLLADSFFRKGEKEIEQITQEINQLKAEEQYLELKQKYKVFRDQMLTEIDDIKKSAKAAKKERQHQRNSKKEILSIIEFDRFEQSLNSQSAQWHFRLKDCKKKWQNKIDALVDEIAIYELKINKLKRQRLQRSKTLQNEIFQQFQLLNIKGEKRSLLEIFAATVFKIPPSGAGECALPKLLQYAFRKKLEPLAMAEFWWGQSPKSEIRKHGHFYPSCKGKCFPILEHMLDGIPTESSPLETKSTTHIDLPIIYEDEDLAIINKPHDFLSVPGKYNEDSVGFRMNLKYPKCEGHVMVHRLDRATSGLLLIAKNKETYKNLQEQFLTKEIKKKYIAILDGILYAKKGTISLPIKPDILDRPRQLVCHETGKVAITKYEVLEIAHNQTRIAFFPETGRTHQLRVHAAHHQGLNRAIVGDDLYGTASDRMYLHATSLQFKHPKTGKTMYVEALPDF